MYTYIQQPIHFNAFRHFEFPRAWTNSLDMTIERDSQLCKCKNCTYEYDYHVYQYFFPIFYFSVYIYSLPNIRWERKRLYPCFGYTGPIVFFVKP